MGGAGRQKFKKLEKAKIKLKGAKLPKGTNVTKTNFKVKKILIPQQLKERNLQEALSNKKLSVKDCLGKLRNGNVSSRTDGLRGIREIISKYPGEIVDNHLGPTIQGIASLTVDLERDIRRDCYKTFALIFTATPQRNILPFFDILASYLKCAMTHIQPTIQEDSLLLLDVYLQHLPQLILNNRDKILPHFLDMISKLRSEAKPERTLTLSLNKQSTSTKWRSRVLVRLSGILKIVIDEKKDKRRSRNTIDEQMQIDDASETPFTTKTKEISSENMDINQVFDSNSPMFFPLIRRNLYETCPLAFLSRKTGKFGNDLSDQVDEGKKIKTYVQMLMPLMFESWLEVRPNLKEESELVISNEASTTLSLLLDIMIQLWEYVVLYSRDSNNSDMMTWFREEYKNDFCTHFLTGFPFNQAQHGKQKQNQKSMSDEQCFKQNFNICYFYCCLNENFRSGDCKNYAKVIFYVDQCISNWKFKNPEVTSILLKVLRYILLETSSTSVNKQTKSLLKTLLEVYIKSQLPQDIRNRILILFCDIIVLNDDLWREYGQEIFTLWLKMLPSLLCKPTIDFNVLKAFLCLAKQNNEFFISSMEEKVDEIVENMPKIKVLNEKSENEGQKLIVNLIFWMKNRSTIEKLVEKIDSNEIPLEENLKIYFKSTLVTKLNIF